MQPKLSTVFLLPLVNKLDVLLLRLNGGDSFIDDLLPSTPFCTCLLNNHSFISSISFLSFFFFVVFPGGEKNVL
jgi:hypothetical protein